MPPRAMVSGGGEAEPLSNKQSGLFIGFLRQLGLREIPGA